MSTHINNKNLPTTNSVDFVFRTVVLSNGNDCSEPTQRVIYIGNSLPGKAFLCNENKITTSLSLQTNMQQEKRIKSFISIPQ